jgi:hypothetical protein
MGVPVTPPAEAGIDFLDAVFFREFAQWTPSATMISFTDFK